MEGHRTEGEGRGAGGGARERWGLLCMVMSCRSILTTPLLGMKGGGAVPPNAYWFVPFGRQCFVSVEHDSPLLHWLTLQMCLDPTGRTVAVVDNFGRVMLLDANDMQVG